jgi:hypothetical protein
MPPRLITGAILVFWLGMTAWLIQREVVPQMLADASPSYQPDLTDEIGAPLIGWRLFRGDKPIGSATSRVVRAMEEIDGKERELDDRSYEFRTVFNLDAADLPIRKLEASQRFSEDRKPIGFGAKIYLPDFMNEPFGIKGVVEEGKVQPRLFVGKVEFKEFKLGKIDAANLGSGFHPLTLIGRLKDLRNGQTWKVTSMDWSEALPKEAEVFGGFLKKAMATPDLIAQVTTDTIEWPRMSNREVECLRIDLGEATKEVAHRVWVRRRDGSVLQYELSMLDTKMNVVRNSN